LEGVALAETGKSRGLRKDLHKGWRVFLLLFRATFENQLLRPEYKKHDSPQPAATRRRAKLWAAGGLLTG